MLANLVSDSGKEVGLKKNIIILTHKVSNISASSIFFFSSLFNDIECFKSLILFRQSLTLILHLGGKRLSLEYFTLLI